MLHALKTERPFFAEIISNKKTFEVRKHDRPFMVGDDVCLQEWDTELKQYSGEEWYGTITHILADDRFCKKGFCILSIKSKESIQIN